MFDYTGDMVVIKGEHNWLDFNPPLHRPRGERMSEPVTVTWDAQEPILQVWRIYHPSGPDAAEACGGFLLERKDGMGICLYIMPGTRATRLHTAIWRSEEGINGTVWGNTAPVDADEFLALVGALADHKDTLIFPAEWLAMTDEQRRKHQEARTL